MKNNTFNIILTPFFILLCFITIYPFIYAFSYSISNGILAAQKDVLFLPRGFTLQNYETMFMDNGMLNALLVSVLRTVFGTILFLLVTCSCAYAMSKKRLKGRKLIFTIFIIPLYFSGGLLPYYILIYDLKLMNNFLVYILPTCYATFFMLIMKVFIESIPESLEESAFLDGAGDFAVAIKIYLPLSKPCLATLALFAGVGQWNAWLDTLLFVTSKELQPLQMVLQTTLMETQIYSIITVFQMTDNNVQISADTYRMAVLIITTLPIMFIYPFAQKYFVKGMTIGSVKL